MTYFQLKEWNEISFFIRPSVIVIQVRVEPYPCVENYIMKRNVLSRCAADKIGREIWMATKRCNISMNFNISCVRSRELLEIVILFFY